ncbi:porin family protein [Flavivirga eckloniae]|uniref:Outer membrane protein beta-barrel domain-containing protein n=1 Tax=Flavivirga eckloniae TaxID=1803846 RepID=A0A2K9PVQ6_9FLAO|nr:porin family protein [Flavivirga eckloniae]AUP81152.1 hypothetical protein C1H87_21525 [Flavivirga eckloniae]
MKRILLYTAIAVFGLSTMNAQELGYGGKAGAAFATLKIKNQSYSITNSETGFYIGGFADIGISDDFGFQPEVLYIAVEGLNQVSIPIMAKYKPSEELSILAGPSVGYLLDVDEGFESVNYGIEIGAAYNIVINRYIKGLIVEARYNFGLANLLENTSSGLTRKLKGFFIGLAYKI